MSSQLSSTPSSLRSDQRERWLRGEHVLVESYLEQHPQLAEDREALLELIEGEYVLRLEHGEHPSIAEYVDRFPSIGDTLADRLMHDLRTPRGGDTDREDLFHLSTRGVACPFCRAEIPFDPEVAGREQLCPKCERKLRLVDETVSLRAKPGRTIGAFELIRRLGAGQFGEVWLAFDTTLRREVAIKMPRVFADSAVTADMFLREARAAAKLRHTNIVPVYETGNDDGQPYIVSAFIQGTNLAQVLRYKKYAPDDAARLCQTLAAAVHHAHQAGIVHRDLKPSNVLIDAGGVAYVADFGLASNASLEEATITRQGDILGTPAYMSPEQARGDAKIGPASDVYALGVMLYELLAGRRPFDGTLEVLLFRILSEEPEPPRKIDRNVPVDLETICLKAMAKAPADRYASAQDFADDLGRYLAGEHIWARRPGLLERALRRARRASRALVAMALLCVIAGLVLGWSFQPPPQQTLPDAVEGTPQPFAPLIMGHPERPSDEWQHDVLINTEPPGASIVLYPLDFDTARPQFSGRQEVPGRTPLRITLSSGQYLVVAHNEQGAFHEVVRSVPRNPIERWSSFNHEWWSWIAENKTIEWEAIKLFGPKLEQEPLAWTEGASEFVIDMTAAGGEIEKWRIPRFGIQVSEVTVGRQKDFAGNSRGRPAAFPAVRFSWGAAMAWAEAHGLRIPDLVEAEFLATTFRRENDDPLAMDSNPDRPVDDPRADLLTTDPPVRGIASGAREWVLTRSTVRPPNDMWMGPRYIVRGGPMALLNEPLLHRDGRWASASQLLKHETFGVRCARSPGPRLKEEQFPVKLPYSAASTESR